MKKLWKNNRVLVLLLAILLICFVTIIVVAISFMKPPGDDPRLTEINKHKISQKFQDTYKETLLDSDNVKETKLTVNDKSRVIFVTIMFDEETELSKAEEIATKSLELFSKKDLEFYEINFILKSENPEYDEKALEDLNKQFEEAEITQEEYEEKLVFPKYQKYRFNIMGAKNLNIEYISWTKNGDKNEK